MSDHSADFQDAQNDLFDSPKERSLLAQLIAESRLYRSGRDYLELLNFVVRLRNFAPFNALLLQVQKPGLRLLPLPGIGGFVSAVHRRKRPGRY
jgi:hypothetical protein